MVFSNLCRIFQARIYYSFMTIGDKKMLMNKIRNTYRELTGQLMPVEPVPKVHASRPAANASEFVRTDIQARRQRRLRRLDRSTVHRVNGWAIRTW
jgi:hypothetical protein